MSTSRSRLRSPYTRLGLKFNPFDRQIPTEACRITPEIEHFARRVINQSESGGFCQISGEPGTGKSVALRCIHEQMSEVPDLTSAILIRPHASVADMYRELGDHFDVELRPSNRWRGTKMLRQRWREHFDSSLHRPLLLVDEAQEMQPEALSELRLLTTGALDASSMLTVVLAGDSRLGKKLQGAQLRPLASRIRVRLELGELPPEELAIYLRHVLDAAGNPALMAPALIDVIAEHSAGNLRAMMHHAHDLLELAIERDLSDLDEQHYLELASARQTAKGKPPSAKAGRARRTGSPSRPTRSLGNLPGEKPVGQPVGWQATRPVTLRGVPRSLAARRPA